MNQKQLAYFLTVYSEGSIQAAADKLYITRQGVSRSLRQLEEELAQPLFHRTANGITPTDFARSILPHVRQLLSEYDYIAGTQTLATQRRSVVTVYALDHIAAWLGADFFLAFAEAHPGITPSFIESTDQGAASSQTLFRTPFCVRLHQTHPLAQKDSLTIRDLAGETVAGKGRAYQCFREKIDRYLLAQGLACNILLESSDETLLTSLAAQNKAIILEHGYTASLVAHPSTVLRPITVGADDGVDICLLARRGQLPTQSARVFQQFLLTYLAAHPDDTASS